MGTRIDPSDLTPEMALHFGISVPKKKSKYRAKRTNGFASKRESDRYGVLALLEMAGAIRDLRTQVRYRLEVNGIHICVYVADFVYTENHQTVVEDTKGFRTPEYKLKRALMLAVHGIAIKET